MPGAVCSKETTHSLTVGLTYIGRNIH